MKQSVTGVLRKVNYQMRGELYRIDVTIDEPIESTIVCGPCGKVTVIPGSKPSKFTCDYCHTECGMMRKSRIHTWWKFSIDLIGQLGLVRHGGQDTPQY